MGEAAPPPNLGCRCFTHSTEIILWATKAAKNSKEKYTFNYAQMVEENGGKHMKNVWRMSTPAGDERCWGNTPLKKPLHSSLDVYEQAQTPVTWCLTRFQDLPQQELRRCSGADVSSAVSRITHTQSWPIDACSLRWMAALSFNKFEIGRTRPVTI